MKIFSIHDSASGAYMRPFFAQADGSAIREFSTLANDGSHPVGEYPADYTLFLIGSFDERTGALSPCEPTSLGNGITYVVAEHMPSASLKAVADA